MNPDPPTARQRAVFDAIADTIERCGYAPTLTELAAAFAIGKITAYGHVDALVRKGWLRRMRHSSRGISLSPAAQRARALKTCPHCGEPLSARENADTSAADGPAAASHTSPDGGMDAPVRPIDGNQDLHAARAG